jgi:hypothetical protein
MRFNGTNQVITIASASCPPSITVGAWYIRRGDGASLGTYSIIFSKTNLLGSSADSWQLRRFNNATWNFDLNIGGSAVSVNTTETASDNVWYFFVGTRNNATGVNRIYIDGKLLKQQTNAGTLSSNNTPIVIGGSRNNGSPSTIELLNGEVAGCFIRNYEMSAAEVAALYKEQLR